MTLQDFTQFYLQPEELVVVSQCTRGYLPVVENIGPTEAREYLICAQLQGLRQDLHTSRRHLTRYWVGV
jgi:hypothetical protein